MSLFSGEYRARLYSEFKAFIQRGSVVNLAVGVIMGGAFGKIITSLVADVLMPPIGYIVGGKRFTELKITLPAHEVIDPLAKGGFVEVEPATINIGNFFQSTFDFLMISICIFAIVKGMNAMKRKEIETPPAAVELSTTDELLTEIRDLLKAK